MSKPYIQPQPQISEPREDRAPRSEARLAARLSAIVEAAYIQQVVSR
jgi:hypothetical protein